MAEIKTILFATDFSDGAARACDLASSLAKLAGARVHVLHVIAELTERRAHRLPAEVIDILVRDVEAHAIEDMQKFIDTHFASLATSNAIVIGTAHEEIVREAIKIDADLIVMGTHGRTGLEKMLVGSTAEKVVRSSPIPVLTIRE
ncbi:universal stress protein [Pseudothauera nasutitermitis]|uniref:Universal stress protein n=1 Tax=Pseudothauera nasutitermitis TaxID=2565930 RepID=A0A4S4AUN3_9RHOO|nr:universal stress protein [Pseudothauera nasutitermitis]THF62306.1 universal stress protein [Pseudothauera nasutitermitis]